jgi:hypothetical protein
MRVIPQASLVTASTLGALVLAVAAQAAGDPEKVLLCHGTASTQNPYVLIDVSVNALQGHFDGSAPGHGWRNAPDRLYDPDSAYTTCEEQALHAGGPE